MTSLLCEKGAGSCFVSIAFESRKSTLFIFTKLDYMSYISEKILLEYFIQINLSSLLLTHLVPLCGQIY